MAPLASVQDVESRLGRALSPEDALRVEVFLADVSAAIRAAAGQEISRATSTVTLRASGGRVWLPQRPVVTVDDVQKVTADGSLEAVIGWTLYGSALEYVPDGDLSVTYTHGYDQVPADVVGLTCSLAMLALTSSSEGALGPQPGVVSESVDDYSVTYDRPAGASVTFDLPERTARWLRRRFGTTGQSVAMR